MPFLEPLLLLVLKEELLFGLNKAWNLFYLSNLYAMLAISPIACRAYNNSVMNSKPTGKMN